MDEAEAVLANPTLARHLLTLLRNNIEMMSRGAASIVVPKGFIEKSNLSDTELAQVIVRENKLLNQ